MTKPNRNDHCPCGSRRKYKKCCLPRDEMTRPQGTAGVAELPFTAVMLPELDDKVDRLMQRLESGAGRAVEPEIRALLKQYPRHHMPHYAMGVYVAMALNDPVGARPYFERAVEIFPPFPEAHYNLANCVIRIGDIPKAVTALRAAVKYSRRDDGIAKMARDKLKFVAENALKDSPFANLEEYLANARLFDEAFVCLQNREFARAVEHFTRVLKVNPAHVQSHGNLGLAYAGLGRRADALACLDKALALDPSYEPAMINRRVVEKTQEGVPGPPTVMQETQYYLERLERERRIVAVE